MKIAEVVASRSTCPRKFVGSVIVRDKTILSTGYNGSIRGMPHCTEVGHMMENDHCVATIHAESNAIIQAAKNVVMIDGGTVYVTASPCWAWGRVGQRVVARLAERHLTDGAKAEIKALLEPGESLADASTWADEVREKMRHTAPWHYVDVPRRAPL